MAGKEVAIKLQPTVPRNSPIRQESKIYKTLSGSPGIPWIMWSGKHGEFDVMILDLLGPSLEDLFKMRNKNFSLKTVLLIADQLVSTSPHRDSFNVTWAIFPFWAALTHTPPPYPPQLERIEFIHSRDLVHRDVKPANFVMGVDKSSSVINVIDFGLAKKFRDPRTTMHIPYQQDEQHRVGTSLFASIHTHNSIGKPNAPRCFSLSTP